MKGKHLNFSVAGMILALIGLIAIQFFWIDRAVTLKEAQFEQSIGNLLYSVIQKLEQQEALKEVQNHPLGSSMFYKSGSNRLKIDLKNNPDSSKLEYRIKQEQIKDTLGSFIRNRKTTRHLISDKDGIKIESSPEQLDTLLSLLSEERLNSMQFRTNLVDEVVNKWFSYAFYQNINQRVSATELDSMLYTELRNRGLKATYKFGIFNEKGESAFDVICPVHGLAQPVQNAYQARLFPNDVFKNPYFLYLYFPNQKTYLLRTMWVLLAASGVFILVIILVFSRTVLTVIRQKHLSEVKNDFINNMTHELKTPISTISLACEALTDGSVKKSEQMKSSFVEMIQAENKRLGVLVENALRTAVLDRGQLILKKDVVDLNQIVSEAVSNIQIQAKQNQSKIELQLFKGALKSSVDKVHVTNVVYNLLDNAIKYSGANALIKVKTDLKSEKVLIYVSDNGPGITKENQKKIFDKLYRIPTGNIHNVKGYGLGLSYVKAIVEKHDGTITVKSQLNKGTTFIIKLPAT
ncbi:sensor histidine kinase [Luteibaculum oceani]|uniref:histidine kinase n=1 Tax=Luteibaculum oceani TaxID=1294296 RepID=A0A5C6VKW6_9FLAO|nr:HAMP domain-containing sensor histidine kinase [Luteibaculum oceani]TXC85431.1 HAMP domain-containing histidine kinase [Luteibaculum oceani]